jgi:hypothetical protein
MLFVRFLRASSSSAIRQPLVRAATFTRADTIGRFPGTAKPTFYQLCAGDFQNRTRILYPAGSWHPNACTGRMVVLTPEECCGC